MKKVLLKRLSILILSAVLCGNIPAVTVFADDTSNVQTEQEATGNSAPEEAQKEVQSAPASEENAAPAVIEENSVAEESPAENSPAASEAPEAPSAPVAPEAPSAPETPDVEGLDAKAANEKISEYNSKVEQYNADVDSFTSKQEEYEKAVDEYNEKAAAFNADAEEKNNAAKTHNDEEDRKVAEYNSKMEAYEKKMATYNKNVETLKAIDQKHKDLIEHQKELLGNIGRLTKDDASSIGTVLEEDYYVQYYRRSVKLGNAGDILVRWEDLAPTEDHKTIIINEDAEKSGETYKIANLHIFFNFKDIYEYSDYMAENGYDCLNINTDDTKGTFIIPAKLIDKIALIEYEVAEADKNDTFTVTSQNPLFSSTPNLMTPRFFDGYTEGAYWVNSGVFSSNAMDSETDWTGTSHTASFKNGTCDYASIKNPLNINQYLYFAKYSNPLPVKPDEYKADRIEYIEKLNPIEKIGTVVNKLAFMDLFEIIEEPEPEEENFIIPMKPADNNGNNTKTDKPDDSNKPVNKINNISILSAAAAPEADADTVPAAPVEIDEVEVPAAAPAAVSATSSVQEEALTEINEEAVPMAAPAAVQIADDSPAAAPYGENAWAFINLLCLLGSLITAVIVTLTLIKKNNSEEEEENAENEENEKSGSGSRFKKLIVLIPAAVSLIAFILTEDLTNPVQLTDRWTMLMIVILAVSVVSAILTRNRKDNDQEDTYGDMNPEAA